MAKTDAATKQDLNNFATDLRTEIREGVDDVLGVVKALAQSTHEQYMELKAEIRANREEIQKILSHLDAI